MSRASAAATRRWSGAGRRRLATATLAAAPAPVVYGRAAPGGWLQYWLYFTANAQDRGIVRSGRHEGDWEMVQYRLGAQGRPVEAVYAQHAGAERCGWREVERRGGRPVVYLANGSHAAYFHTGVRPDVAAEPERRGGRPRRGAAAGGRRGHRARAHVDALPAAMGRGARGLVPARGGLAARPGVPATGPLDRSEGWARAAEPCTGRRCTSTGACDGGETALAAAVAAPAALLLLLALRRRRRRA